MQAAIEENKRLGLRSTSHHAQLNVVRWNVLNSARAGLNSMEHWYGLPEALFNNRVIQNYPQIIIIKTNKTDLRKQENYGNKQLNLTLNIGIM